MSPAVGDAGVPRAGEEAGRVTALTAAELDSLARTAVADGGDGPLRARVGGARPRPGGPPALGPYVQALLGDGGAAAGDEELVVAAAAGDAFAREELILAMMPRLVAVARRHGGAGIELADLLQEGVLAMLDALTRYDPRRGVPFWAYASAWVRGAMARLAGDQRRAVRLPPRALSDLSALKESAARLRTASGAEPPLARVAADAGIDLGRAQAVVAAAEPPASLDRPAGGAEDARAPIDALTDPRAEDAYDEVVIGAQAPELRVLLGTLSVREREVLAARFGLGGRDEESLAAIGRRLGISRERARQVENRALTKLRLAVGGPG